MAINFPDTPTVGQIFVGPSNIEYQWDGTKWVALLTPIGYAPVLSPSFTGDPRAPTPPSSDSDSSIATTAFVHNVLTAAGVTGDKTDVGRNLVENGSFNVFQRGTGPFNVNNQLTADRWRLYLTGTNTANVYVVPAPDGDISGIAATAHTEYINAILSTSFTSGTGYVEVQHRIEQVRKVSGRTICVSFWASGTTGGQKLGIRFGLFFGTGGSPSANVEVTPQYVSLTASTYVRYSVVLNVPSSIGKTFGTNGDSFAYLGFVFTNASDVNVGAQTGACNLWGVQAEFGSTPSAFEIITYTDEFERCLRNYQTGYMDTVGYGVVGVPVQETVSFQRTMRAMPVMSFTNVSSANVGAAAMSATRTQAIISGTVQTTGWWRFNVNFIADASQ